jgi:hypothetical protein
MGKRERHDGQAKRLLRGCFQMVAEVRTEREVGEPQYIDCVVIADPARAGKRRHLGVLGRMLEHAAGRACLFEPYSQTPRRWQVEDCLDRQRALWREARREARRSGESMPEKPLLWILSPGRAMTALAVHEMRALPDWPEGFYAARPQDALYLVVLSELPRTRETLYLRLLSVGGVAEGAVDELGRLPADTWEWQAAMPILVDKERELAKIRGGGPMLEPRHIEKLRRCWEEQVKKAAIAKGIEQGIEVGREQGIEVGREQGIEVGREQGIEVGREQGIEVGREQGIQQGERMVLLRLLASRFGQLPQRVARRVERARPAQLERWLERILTAKSLDQVFAKK